MEKVHKIKLHPGVKKCIQASENKKNASRRQLGMEKQLKEKMIHSVMPPKVTNSLF